MLVILLFLPIIAVAHFIFFPQETRCIFIDFADFKKQENLYFRKNVSENTIQKLLQLKLNSEKKIFSFWGTDAQLDYKLIYCEDRIDYKNYGRAGAPAVANIKLGAYVVIPEKMFDENILAHEISHTVLYRKIGWYKLHFKIPTWFDEGLAMQVDERSYYSIDSLKNNASSTDINEIMEMDTPQKFHAGSLEKIVMNYKLSKFIVYKWLKSHSLKSFIDAVNDGDSFIVAYNK